MSETFYCIDNDIIYKLATIDLFDETLTILNTNYNYVKILETFSHRTRKKKNRKKGSKPDNYNIEKALEIAEKVGEISEENISQDIYTNLITISQSLNDKNKKIDKGDAILITYLSEENKQGNSNYLLTGDKNCLRALAIPELAEIVNPIKGKIWCFEQLILKNIEQYQFNYVQNKIYPFRDCDNNLKFIFGYSEKAPEDRVKEDLRKEIIKVQQETNNILYPYPD